MSAAQLLHPGLEQDAKFRANWKSTNPALVTAAKFLSDVKRTGKLGPGPPETVDYTVYETLTSTVPYSLLIFQLVWSSIVTGAAYYLADKSAGYSTFSDPFWDTHINVSSSVINGVGWALFVVLGFYIGDASNRYRSALFNWRMMTANLVHITRQVIQIHTKAHWHPGAIDRIVSHLTAYPIALKMTLRGERDRSQLHCILDPRDLDDLLNADYMHLHCMRVVRSYMVSNEPDMKIGFCPGEKSNPGPGSRNILGLAIDAVDGDAIDLVRISEFQPAVGYVNHLHVFMYIWLFFLPLNLVGTSGWFTVFFGLLITYGVGMLFRIASALNAPFGYDPQDINLNHISSASALEVLTIYGRGDILMKDLINPDHETPDWLEKHLPDGHHIRDEDDDDDDSKLSILSQLMLYLDIEDVQIPLGVFTIWSLIVLFSTYFVARNNEASQSPTCRWWCLYIPLNPGVVSYVSLGVTVLLGFWLNDAYAGYWNGLQIWQTEVRPLIDDLSNEFTLMFEQNHWHQRDRERLLSFMTAIPYVAVAHLRDDRDFILSTLDNILSEEDLKAIYNTEHMLHYVFHVLYAYWFSFDSQDQETCSAAAEGRKPIKMGSVPTTTKLYTLEKAFHNLDEIRLDNLPNSFTIHLYVFTAIWLGILPLSLVTSTGFLSIILLLPIAYSILTLISLGKQFMNPFGSDAVDIPVRLFCREIRRSIHSIYTFAMRGDQESMKDLIHGSDYDPEKLKPKPITYLDKVIHEHREPTPTFFASFKAFFAHLPEVPHDYQFVATTWIIAAVFLSYGLSFLWEPEKREHCQAWCSPIDVDSGTLASIGFALFLILTFRASDAITRYDSGAKLIYSLESTLRSLALEYSQTSNDGVFHENDKERFISLIVQVPLFLQDRLLHPAKPVPNLNEGFLSEADKIDLKKDIELNITPMEALIRRINAYVYLHDMNDETRDIKINTTRVTSVIRINMLNRVSLVRTLTCKIFALKRFPVSQSYTRHQRLFTILWLFLLPLSMASISGFLTMVWAPMISFGVLALENIAIKLVDPLGDDAIDVPVKDMCKDMADSIMTAVHKHNWNCNTNTQSTTRPTEPFIAGTIEGNKFKQDHTLAHFENTTEFDETEAVNSSSLEKGTVIYFRGRDKSKMKPSLYAHILHSVPWWVLLGMTVWSLISVYISYLLRTGEAGGRWWTSRISIQTDVATYTSFAAFMLLSFYVTAAYGRFHSAADLWCNRLSVQCHAMASMFSSLYPKGSIHEEDQDRILSMIAALPLVLKHELRGNRDILELKGLVSESDMAKLQCAPHMATYCVDVLRSYFIKSCCYPERFKNPNIIKGVRVISVNAALLQLEGIIADARFLGEFQLSPAFLSLLNALMGIWFVLLPFVLADDSGWFTLFSVPVIAYGLFGMHAVAAELQQPFGTDLNDIDLDTYADDIVRDVLHIRKYHNEGPESYIDGSTLSHPQWSNEEGCNAQPCRTNETIIENLSVAIKLGWHAFSGVEITLMTLWAAICVILSWYVSFWWPFGPSVQGSCEPFWCSRIAVEEAVKVHLGFALFLLLAFRLGDSHQRYSLGYSLWQSSITSTVHSLSLRFAVNYQPSKVWHSEDIQRIAGHISAFCIMLCSALRGGENYGAKLRDVVSESDALRIENSNDKVMYCLDVVRTYVMDNDRVVQHEKKRMKAGVEDDDGVHACPLMERILLQIQVSKLVGLAGTCQLIKNVPLPFGYIMHLKITLVLWMALLPLGLVEQSGWLSILWFVPIAYGMLGIETWSEELSDPFGYELSDVPIDEFCDRLIDTIKANIIVFKDQSSSLIKEDRSGFNARQLPEDSEVYYQEDEYGTFA